MKYPVYSYRDNAYGFGAPIVETNEMTAVRGFRFACSGQNGMMNFAPQDYDLYMIGYFDPEKGEMIPELPSLVISGVNAIEK